MAGAVTAASQSVLAVQSRRIVYRPSSVAAPIGGGSFCSSNVKLVSNFPRINLRCNCSSGDSGENQSRTILDAFFLGKAVAEAVNERVESAVGEFLSVIGRLQAEQQKQIQEFQDDVLEKAQRAKEQAAREAMGSQGLFRKTASSSTVNGVASDAVLSSSSSSSASISEVKEEED
ncbi:uncharacterized protein At4g13200, chloroplastic-like [Andrographis paniculata]|uniref:uncharacterized protein At4g13200, chloroplastic-like n=1 Tax=Andrographis paniculata TaxID=175694 RepID=UPI0021E81F37|nr:uncharacterized protein At4g13200, chloroplastic-like [Andrographis paniculata]